MLRTNPSLFTIFPFSNSAAASSPNMFSLELYYLESTFRERERQAHLQNTLRNLEYAHQPIKPPRPSREAIASHETTNNVIEEDEAHLTKRLSTKQVSMVFGEERVTARKAFPRLSSLMSKRKPKSRSQSSSTSKPKRSRRRSFF